MKAAVGGVYILSAFVRAKEIHKEKAMTYEKPEVVAQNAATGSYAAGCPTNNNGLPVVLQKLRTYCIVYLHYPFVRSHCHYICRMAAMMVSFCIFSSGGRDMRFAAVSVMWTTAPHAVCKQIAWGSFLVFIFMEEAIMFIDKKDLGL